MSVSRFGGVALRSMLVASIASSVTACASLPSCSLAMGAPSCSHSQSSNARGSAKNPHAVIETLNELGLKVSDTTVSVLSTTTPVPKVRAVLRGGPAYYAGIVPGDMIVGFGEWQYPSSETLRSYASRIFLNHSWVPAQVVPVGHDLRRGDFVTLAPPLGSGLAGVAEWIDDIPAPTPNGLRRIPGWQGDSVAAVRSFERARQVDLAYFNSHPCEVDPHTLEDRATATGILAVRASANYAMLSADYSEADRYACNKSHEGLLPKFEATLMVLLQNNVDPCTFDTTKDSPEVQRVMSKFSPSDYAAITPRNENAVLESGNEARKRCVLNFIKSQLLSEAARR